MRDFKEEKNAGKLKGRIPSAGWGTLNSYET